MRWNPPRQEWVTYSATRQVRTAFPPKEYCPLCPGAELNFPTEIPQAQRQLTKKYFRKKKFDPEYPNSKKNEKTTHRNISRKDTSVSS